MKAGSEQVKRWFQFFPPEQCLFLNSEDFFREEAAGLERALGFLELQEWHPVSFVHYNDSRSVSQIPEPAREWLYH